MANQLAIKAHTQPGDEVIMEATSHPYNFEGGAIAAISGVQVYCLQGVRGILHASQVEAAVRPADHHYAVTRLVCMENTHNRGGGSIYHLGNMQEIFRVAKAKGLSVHLDGARLWNASVATGVKLKEYAKCAHSVSVCISKGLGCPVGSLVAGSKEFVDRIHRFRKMVGGGLRQAGILAAAGIYALDHHVDRLKEDHANARRLALGLKEIRGISVNPDHVETNIIIFGVAGTGMTSPAVRDAMKNEGVLMNALPGNEIRLVTHLDVTQDDIDKASAAFRKVIR
jgi:threonine aldolase